MKREDAHVLGAGTAVRLIYGTFAGTLGICTGEFDTANNGWPQVVFGNRPELCGYWDPYMFDMVEIAQPRTSSFAEQSLAAIETAVVDLIKRGDWLVIPHSSRVHIGLDVLKESYRSINMDRVLEMVRSKLEQKIAGDIVSNLTAEIATDVKRVMSDAELRAELREAIRSKIEGLDKSE